MPRITFTEDVTLPDMPGGPHYRRGYSPDVSDKEAQKWIGKGVAVAGVLAVAPAEPEPSEAPPVLGKKKRFRPL